MRGKNRVILRGNLTDKPSMRYTKTKEPVAWFVVASNYHVRSADGSGWEQSTDFIPVLCFKHSAAFAEKYLSKGVLVECEGKLKNRERELQNGKRTYELVFIANEITLLSKARDTAHEPQSEEYQDIEEIPETDYTEDYNFTEEEIAQAIAAKNYATYQ